MQKQNKQASVLAVAMICLGIFLVTALSVSLVTLSEKRSATGASRSNLAFQIANTGAEKVLQLIKVNQGKYINDIDGNCDGVIKDETTGYEVEIRDVDGKVMNTENGFDCNETEISEIASIKSVGTSGQNQRVISVVAAAAGPDWNATPTSFKQEGTGNKSTDPATYFLCVLDKAEDLNGADSSCEITREDTRMWTITSANGATCSMLCW